jgi:hypothetical protein
MEERTKKILKQGLWVTVVLVIPFGIPIATVYSLYSLYQQSKQKYKQSSIPSESSKSTTTKEYK